MNDQLSLKLLINRSLILLFFLAFTTLSCSSSGSASRTSEYYDEDGSPMTAEEFQEKSRDQSKGARWVDIENGKRVTRFSGPEYQQYMISYPSFRMNLEKATGQDFDINTLFLIEYRYKDDQCSSRYSNNWDKQTIRERKSVLAPQKRQLEEEYPYLRYFHFFEEGVQLANRPDLDEEFFFSDQENFLRQTIFKNPTLCGSFAIIKPSGEVLVYNGESRADVMARHLEQTSWELFFGKN